MSKEIVSDPVYENAVSTALDRCRQSVQDVLDCWNGLHFESLTTGSQLYELLHNPQVLYDEQVKKTTTIPEGLSKEAEAQYLKGLSLPPPDQLYDLAALARRSVYTTREMNLFAISKGGKVSLSKESQSVIKQKSVFAENQLQEKAFNELSELVEKFNSVNSYLGGRLLTQDGRLSPLVKPPARDGMTGPVTVEPEALKQLFKTLK